MMIRVLLGACLCAIADEVFSRSDLEAPCIPPKGLGDARVSTFLGGRAALITCGDIQRLAFCSHGKWSSDASCPDNKKQDHFEKILSKYQLKKREKRSPNNGKYEELRRQVKVQRQIRAGLLETTIDTTTPTIFRAHPGGNIYLACRIENLGAHSVTWLRRRDNHVLAIDTSVLNADNRLTATYEEKTETWLLGILGAREYDNGQYECRVSTRRPLKRVVHLQIIPADQPLHAPVHSADEPDLDFVLRNITTLWEELHSIRQEIGNHLHHGHQEPNHDQVLQEVETLHHEHHVHHLHHPHEGHNAHHNTDLLNHLSEVHGHLDDHSDGQPIDGHLHGHGHSHDHHHDQEGEHTHEHTHEHEHEDGAVHTHAHAHEHDHEHEEHDHEHDDIHDGQDHLHDEHHHHHLRHHENEDRHDAHGLHFHENEHEYAHEHEPDSHDHHHDHSSEIDHHHDDHSSENDDDDDDKDGESAPLSSGRPVIPNMHQTDPWIYANCNLKPNADMPESNVRGSIIISQKKDKTGPVYFDLNLTGFDVATTGRIHGFHVHERPVTEGKCGSTGGHFNPEGVVHGAPEDNIRHVGDLGNIEVDENGAIQGHIISDSKVAFMGTNTIIRKAIVVHAGVDDLGKGGDAGSLATGNAGGRLACCNIFMGSETPPDSGRLNFRFKG